MDAEAVREGSAQRSGEDGDGIPIQVVRSGHGETRCSLSRLFGLVEKRQGRACRCGAFSCLSELCLRFLGLFVGEEEAKPRFLAN